ncbi:FGGY-family carbohydrate kinase [Rhodobium gokarnense]|uniref:FGGY-family pentulose kinase n=1 Tax=Rhodobium gokarnense TaxID=364296 RepID=A0ABT3H9X6_9HYPH|nr:FGGY-family carbohydrate kinase [Rhodobium gokarnense]MCW2307193.1 FGGY-family pentulose kinase [Rhodobium gokarnense]
MRNLVCAVDVGTGSARAGVFEADGTMLARKVHPIVLSQPAGGEAEHDSQDIWRAACRALQAAMDEAGATAERIAGIAFDATCSLVVRDRDGGQVSVSKSGDDRFDTVSWMDHRALAEADECTATGHRVLEYVGEAMSPEMQTPKLMWLKRRLPASWARAGLAFDLTDFLAWKATGNAARSQCTLTAKWTYLAHDDGWQQDFFDAVGLGDLVARTGLPATPLAVAAPLGTLTAEAASDLGLDTDCAVGVGAIDAFAGTLGVLGAFADEDIERHVALIAGTSSCVMGMAREAQPAKGVWGPYYGACLPGLWLREGGQSATGALLDLLIRQHGNGLKPDCAGHAAITDRITELRARDGDGFADGIHVLPDFHGNRTPFADPHARGVISGLTLDTSFDALCRLYWRTAVAIALGVRQILEHMAPRDGRIDTLHLTGGHARNPVLMELYADATDCEVRTNGASDTVLLGSAMIAAAAGGLHPDLRGACRAMGQDGDRRAPNPAARARYDADYRVFLKMQEHRAELDALTL